MNQILVTEKLYVTPELRRKKKIYKLSFFLSIFAICCLSSACIYAEYDRNKSEEIGISMLNSETVKVKDDTTITPEANALIVQLTQISIENLDIDNEEEKTNTTAKTETFTSSKGDKYEYIGTISIPKINLSYKILSEHSVELLKISVCKFHGANPNQVGNLCIAGHNYRRKGKFFSDLDELECGDIIQIEDLDGVTIDYKIYDIFTVDPEEPSSTDCTTQVTNGKKEVTLITCTDDNIQRRILKCTENV